MTIELSEKVARAFGFYGDLLPKLTPTGPRVFLLKIASKQPLLKASQIMQN
jgi:hypothetical protein